MCRIRTGDRTARRWDGGEGGRTESEAARLIGTEGLMQVQGGVSRENRMEGQLGARVEGPGAPG